LELTPEEANDVKRVRAIFDEHLKAHVVDDLKVLLSTHPLLVATVLIGFFCIIMLLARIL